MFRTSVLLAFILTTSWAQGKRPDASANFLKETIAYKQVGADEIKADVYRIAGRDRQPVILWIHGGALIFGSRDMLPADERDAFLKAGYAIIAIDYRLAPETKLREIFQDIQDAYRWIQEKGPTRLQIDSQRIAVIGQSAGAYLALLLGARENPPPKAVVSFYGYGSLAGEWSHRPSAFFLRQRRVTKEEALRVVSARVLSESPVSPRDTFYLYCRQNGLWLREVTGFDPAVEPQKLQAYSPERLVTSSYPPTLLLHGDRDTDVPFQMSEQMAAALQTQGVAHRLYRMAGFDHLFDVFPKGLSPVPEPIGLKDPRVAAAFQDLLSFLTKYVG